MSSLASRSVAPSPSQPVADPSASQTLDQQPYRSTSRCRGRSSQPLHSASTEIQPQAYAISALMKIYAFEVADGRKVDMLPECQSFIEELLASHSTDLQQHAYELQAVVIFSQKAIVGIERFAYKGVAPITDAYWHKCSTIMASSSLYLMECNNSLHHSFARRLTEAQLSLHQPSVGTPSVSIPSIGVPSIVATKSSIDAFSRCCHAHYCFPSQRSRSSSLEGFRGNPSSL